MTTVYITRYALTKGIIETTTDHQTEGVNIISATIHPGGYKDYFHGKDWWTDLDKAKARAEEMRQRKLTTLRKQLDKLSKLEIAHKVV